MFVIPNDRLIGKSYRREGNLLCPTRVESGRSNQNDERVVGVHLKSNNEPLRVKGSVGRARALIKLVESLDFARPLSLDWTLQPIDLAVGIGPF